MPTNVNNTYLYFDVRDFSNTSTLSTYTLDNTPLSFLPNLTTSTLLSSSKSISNKTLHWDFGDGSSSTVLSATHTYRFPGNYKVTLTVFDQYGQAYDSSYTPTIQVIDFVPTQIQFRSSTASTDGLTAGAVNVPLYVDVYNSWQSYPALSASEYTLYLYASGSNSDYTNLITYENDRWAHLRQLHKFLIPETLNNVTQYVVVSSVSATQTPIYANIQNGSIQVCGQNDTGSVFAGTTGYSMFYYVDDKTSSTTQYVFAALDNAKMNDAFTLRRNLYNYINYPPYGFQNLSPTVLSISAVAFNPASKLSITTTGIDGEGTLSATTFDIPQACWQDTQIPYTIKLKDSANYTTKNYPPLSSSTANLNVTGLTAYDVKTGIVYFSAGKTFPVQGITFVENFSPQAPQSIGSFYKGYFTSTSTAENCVLTASVVIVNPDTTVYTITGSSSTFNIYSTGGKYNIAKVNEDWDASGFYKSLRYQETLLDKDIFFTDFLGTIVGDISAYPYELGKTVYEKIANFTENKANIEKVNVDSLIAFCTELSIQFEQYSYTYPPQLRRLVDLFSIKQKALWGDPNTFSTNFNNYKTHFVTDITIGANLSAEISPFTGNIKSGSPIVAYELFSNIYSLINTTGVNGYNIGDTIPLSSFSYDWGWGLIAPQSLSGSDISSYYKFYLYNSKPENTYYNNSINWSDPYTTLTPNQSTFSQWSNDTGIMQTALSYELTKGLGLFTSAVQIALT